MRGARYQRCHRNRYAFVMRRRGSCMPQMRVLIAEDDSELAEVLATGLRRENMAVDIALAGDVAEEKLTAIDYDVLVLDRDLPGIHGDDLCRQVVAAGIATRILMLPPAAR